MRRLARVSLPVAEAGEQSQRHRRVRFARDVVVWLSLPVLLVVGAVTLLCQHSALPWPFELAYHFRTQALVGGFGLAAFLFALRRPRIAVIALVFGIMNLRAVVPLWLDPAVPERGAVAPPTLRLLVANIYTHNPDHHKLIDLVRRERPDLLLLQEISDEWLSALEPLAADYPHRIVEARSDNMGIALYTKAPLRVAEVARFGRGDVPTIVAEFDHGGRRFHLFVTHAWPPVSKEGAEVSRGQMRAVALAAAELGKRTIMAGDFNATPWSRTLRELESRSNLRNARRGFGPQPTWPAHLPWLFRIPIDHLLHSRDLEVLDHRLGPDFGSDHLPLIVDLR